MSAAQTGHMLAVETGHLPPTPSHQLWTAFGLALGQPWARFGTTLFGLTLVQFHGFCTELGLTLDQVWADFGPTSGERWAACRLTCGQV